MIEKIKQADRSELIDVPGKLHLLTPLMLATMLNHEPAVQVKL